MKKKTQKTNVRSLTKKTLLYTIVIGLIVVMVCLAIQSIAVTKSQSAITEETKTEKTLKEKLADCMPKSDMGSKKICDDLIKTITTYKGCAEAGFPIQESYPERCRLTDGRTFTNSK